MRRLAIWHRLEPGSDIEIIFTSPGGDVISGLALFDYIQELRASGHKVTTKAQGYAASMASILLQAGDVRVMNAEAWLLIHEASFGAGGKLGEVEDTVEWVKKVSKRIKDIYAKRSSLTAPQIEQRWRRKDWWIDADEALKLGFCDEIEGELIVPEKKELGE
jgi:ATP-dependent Clp endopeptidase proteolytic subunit ClpP